MSLIAYFIGNISAKKCQNPLTFVRVIASQTWDVFWDTVYSVRHCQLSWEVLQFPQDSWIYRPCTLTH